MHMRIVEIVALLAAITVHEASHGFMAARLGDPTPKLNGRLTLNPLAHLDLYGTILFPALLILLRSPVLLGWAKPVPVNPHYFRSPRQGWALVSLAGPLSNLAMAAVAAALLKTGFLWPAGSLQGGIAAPLYWFLLYCLDIGVLLAVFNLIPIPPLDGGHFLEGVLPDEIAREYRKMEPFGMIIIFLLLYLGLLDRVLAPIHAVVVSSMLH